MTRTHEITDLLQAWSRGDPEALAKLLPLVDHELKRIAHAYMLRERAARSLYTSALVQEALARLIVDEPIEWKSRKQFFAIIAWRMRNILVEHARKRKAEKRGKGTEHLNIDDVQLSNEMSELLDLLDEALKKLARFDEQKSQIVELRYFGGFTLQEVASIMELSETKVEREWRITRAWLKREITGKEA
ncbi:MAG TPA: ECF-type sigma factor [Pyrinomonadaceae bacterium]|jgi:RNA polymerase sigma factor (TIGR02999 family)|nr:ECF-type sigma factor [Pyrinomonadaceae bacterium]